MQLWGKPSCHQATVPHHPLFLKKIINQVCGKYVSIFHKGCRHDSFFPFSSLILLSSAFSLPHQMTSSLHRKDTSCREGLPPLSGSLSSLVMPRSPDGPVDMCSVLQLCGLPTLPTKLLSGNVKALPS